MLSGAAGEAAADVAAALATLQEACAGLAEDAGRGVAAAERCRQLASAGLLPLPAEGSRAWPELRSWRRLEDDLTQLISRNWLLDSDSFYITFVVLLLVIAILVVVITEVLVLRTTLLGFCLSGVDRLKHYVMGDEHLTSVVAGDSKAVSAPPGGSVRAFWETVEHHFEHYLAVWKDRDLRPDIFASDKDTVEFAMLNFPSKEAESDAVITLWRHGKCQGPVVAHLRTRDGRGAADNEVGFKARQGFDYEPLPPNFSLRFEDGERKKVFHIKLKPTDDSWLPTRWFYVQLQSIEGDAVMSGPSVSTAEAEDSSGGPTCRVYILQDDTFPPNMPMTELHVDNDMVCLRHFYYERIFTRGRKFWKALIGYCYAPVHSVVVTPLIQSYMIDLAAHPKEGGSYSYIILLVAMQFVSTILLRVGDIMVVRNRGRTGGTRQEIRRQLLSKVLMMDHEEQYKYPGALWFHSALLDVDIIVRDGYWQLFIMISSVWGLILCLAVLVWKALYTASKGKTSIQVANFMPAMVLVALIPLVLLCTLYRRKQSAELVDQRQQKEEWWVDTVAWLTSRAQSLYVFSQREFSFIQETFMKQNHHFLFWHQKARNYMNDSTWIAKWLGSVSYCIILCWASFRLFESRADPEILPFSTGDMVILLSVFAKCGSYLGKVSTSFVSMQKGAVALRRVANLLNLPEKRSLQSLPRDVHLEEGILRSHIILRNVALILPDQPLKLGPSDPIEMRAGASELRIPLGKIVCIVGSNESRRLSVLNLIAGNLQPTRGEVLRPAREWSITLPFQTVGLPGCSCSADLSMAGARHDEVGFVTSVFALDPQETHALMSPGQAALHALIRAMIRDPTILLAVRPAAQQPVEIRRNVMMALVLWQMGGGWRVIQECFAKADASLKDVEVKPQLENHRRTLIIAEGIVPSYIPEHLVHVIDVDEYFQPDEKQRLLAAQFESPCAGSAKSYDLMSLEAVGPNNGVQAAAEATLVL